MTGETTGLRVLSWIADRITEFIGVLQNVQTGFGITWFTWIFGLTIFALLIYFFNRFLPLGQEGLRATRDAYSDYRRFK